MRRLDKEITEVKAIKRILSSTKYVTLAMCMNNQPYLVSLSHGYDQKRNCVYFHCAEEGKKIAYLESNNTVWGQALLDRGYVDGECTHLYASVHFSGKVTLIHKLDEKRKAIECMMRQLDPSPESLIAGLDTKKLERTLIGRIDIDYMSGKKSKKVIV